MTGRILPRLAIAAAAVAPGLTWVAATQSPAAATTITESVTFTQAGQSTYSVPPGTVSLSITAIGAPGASVGGNPREPDGTPGMGAEVTATIPPVGGVGTLYVEVGSTSGPTAGGASTFAEAGGGASDVQVCSNTLASCVDTADPATDPRIVVAGGGGGGGEDGFGGGTGGAGGNAGGTTAISGPGAGGAGADTLDGGPGTNAGYGADPSEAPGGSGSANCGSAGDGIAGTPGVGGAGSNANNGDSANGGGGGGGWVGGSGGGAGDCTGAPSGGGGGGGAGDSFVESAATSSAIQTAGGAVPSVTIVATIDQQPAITSAPTATFDAGSAGTFQVTTTGNPTPALTEDGTLPDGVTFTDNGDGTATLAGTPAAGAGGSYPITIDAANGVGSDAVQEFTLSVDQPIAFTSASAATFVSGVASAFTVTTTGYPDASISAGGTALPSGVTLVSNGDGTATLSISPSASPTPGIYSFVLIGDNGIGADSANQPFTLTIDEAPAVTSASTAVFQVAVPGTFTVTAVGFPAGAAMTVSDGGAALPSGVTFQDNGNGTATLSGTPAAGTGGSYPFTITAANGVAPDGTQAFTLDVDQAPAITSSATATLVTGTSGTFTVTTSGFPAPALRESGALPSGVTFQDNGNGTATLGGTAAAGSGGTYPITVSASNGIAPGDAQSFTLTVDQAPAFTNAASTTFLVGSAGSFAFAATGFPASTIQLSGRLPAGVSLSGGSGGAAKISGTPQFATGGIYRVTLAASNGVTPNATQSFTLTVNEAVAITSATTARLELGQPGSFNVTTVAFPGGANVRLSDGSSKLPSGLSFHDNRNGTATISGTPSDTSAADWPITVTASNGIGPTAVQQLTVVVGTAPGYVDITNVGGVLAFEGAHYEGSLPGDKISDSNVIGAAETIDGRGYWIVDAVGRVYHFGEARAIGPVGESLGTAVVGIVATPDDGGYWVIAKDGAVYSYGDAHYFGSLPQSGHKVDDVVGMAPTLDGRGYYIALSTGTVYAYGDAVPHGSVSNPGAAIVGISLDRATGGYWLVSANGAIFALDAKYFGGTPSGGTIIGMAPSPDGGGYLLLDRDGIAYGHGDALSAGAAPPGSGHIIAIASP